MLPADCDQRDVAKAAERAARLGVPGAVLEAAKSICVARNSQAAGDLLRAVQATPYNARPYHAAAQRAAQLGLDQELQQAKRALQRRQGQATEALHGAAAAVDAAAFAGALAAARQLEVTDSALTAAAHAFQLNCQPVSAPHVQHIEHLPPSYADIPVESGGAVLTISRLAQVIPGKTLETLSSLDLSLERLTSFGNDLGSCRSLVELHARSNKLIQHCRSAASLASSVRL